MRSPDDRLWHDRDHLRSQSQIEVDRHVAAVVDAVRRPVVERHSVNVAQCRYPLHGIVDAKDLDAIQTVRQRLRKPDDHLVLTRIITHPDVTRDDLDIVFGAEFAVLAVGTAAHNADPAQRGGIDHLRLVETEGQAARSYVQDGDRSGRIVVDAAHRQQAAIVGLDAAQFRTQTGRGNPHVEDRLAQGPNIHP